MSQARFIMSSLFLVALLACSKEKNEAPQAQVQPTPQAPPVEQTIATPPEPVAAPRAGKLQPAAKRSQTAARQQPPAAPMRDATVMPDQTAPVLERAERAPSRAYPPDVREPVAPAPIRPSVAIIPAGTRFHVRLTEAISSAEKRSGDKFEATLADNLEVDGRFLAPKGSIVIGRLSDVERARKVEGHARLAMILTELQVRGESYGMETNTLTFEGESSTKDDVAKIGAGAGIGAAIGAIAGGGKGAAIGAVIGGGAGTATVMATRGKEVEFPAEQEFTFKLERDLRFTIDSN
jgi:hypothetical protein